MNEYGEGGTSREKRRTAAPKYRGCTEKFADVYPDGEVCTKMNMHPLSKPLPFQELLLRKQTDSPEKNGWFGLLFHNRSF